MRLFLCEKPSQGKDIGRILGATQRGEGCLNGSGVTVTWCIGHLVEAAAPEVYDAALKRWSLEQLPIIPQQWRVEVKPQTATQFKVVKTLLAKATHLVIATDADREGELIAREIIDLCGYRGPIARLWLSALNDASIRTALAKLRPSAETLPMYYSALARSRADWLVGMNLSRLFTVLGRQAGYDGVLSVGRVQTPTLKLVVDRDREIAAFVSVPYWAIDVSLSAGGQTFTAQWVPPKACTDDAGQCLCPGRASRTRTAACPSIPIPVVHGVAGIEDAERRLGQQQTSRMRRRPLSRDGIACTGGARGRRCADRELRFAGARGSQWTLVELSPGDSSTSAWRAAKTCHRPPSWFTSCVWILSAQPVPARPGAWALPPAALG